MQTISVPYACAEEDRYAILAARRLYSACVRTAYANAVRDDGAKVPEKDLRHLVKARHAGADIDAWLKHCATLEGIALRKARPDGKLVFGGRAMLERRRKGLVDRETWRAKRLGPLCSIGDKNYKGNRHFRLAEDARSCRFAIYGQAVTLDLPGAGAIAVEKGLGKLRSGGRNRSLNFHINYWARTVFLAQLRRKACLAGLKVIEAWSGYSTTIGNLAFALPDACASAAEIGRRGLAREAGEKDVLPDLTDEVVAGLWKDRGLPPGATPRSPSNWQAVHRGLKAAKLGVRRPHPALPDPGVRRGGTQVTPCGLAVTRLRLRRRPGVIFRPARQGSA